MKKTFLILFVSLLSGSLLGLLMFKVTKNKIETVFNESKTLTFFQVGVFRSKNNAKNLTKKINSSIVIKDDNYYRVYTGILENIECIKKMQQYLKDNQIDYYIKKQIVGISEFTKYLNEVELIYLETNDNDVINNLNVKILNKYQEVYSESTNQGNGE